MVATIQVTNFPVSGGLVDFTFSGMMPNAQVAIYIVSPYGAGKYLLEYVYADSYGGYSGSFTDYEQGGNYTLEADDGLNDVATTFVLGSGATGTPTIKVTNSPVSGGTVEFACSGMALNAPVDVKVLDSTMGSDYPGTYWSDGSGNLDGSFGDLDPAGSYTLEANDGQGEVALTQFTLGAGSGGGGGGGSTGSSGTGTNWASIISSLLSWIVAIAAIAIFAPLLKSLFNPAQKQLPPGTQVIELPPSSYSIGGQ